MEAGEQLHLAGIHAQELRGHQLVGLAAHRGVAGQHFEIVEGFEIALGRARPQEAGAMAEISGASEDQPQQQAQRTHARGGKSGQPRGGGQELRLGLPRHGQRVGG